jgi:hypothetical protein
LKISSNLNQSEENGPKEKKSVSPPKVAHQKKASHPSIFLKKALVLSHSRHPELHDHTIKFFKKLKK